MRLVLALALLATLPATAHGAVTRVQTPEPAASVAILGDGRPVWTEVTPRGAIRAVTLDPGGGRRVLAVESRPRADELLTATVAADGPDVVLVVYRSACPSPPCRSGFEERGKIVRAGSVFGAGSLPRRPELEPRSVESVSTPPQVADGIVLVGTGVLDLRTGGFRRLSAGETRIAGELLAHQEELGGSITVTGSRDQRERYRVDAPGLIMVELDRDGTLLLRPTTGPFWLATPAAPTPRVLPLRSLGVGAEFASGRLMTGFDHTRWVFDLAGNLLGVVLPFRGNAPGVFDGERLAWVEPACALSFVTVWRLGDPPDPGPEGRCRRPAIRDATVTRTALVLALACPASATLGCRLRGTVEVRSRGGRWRADARTTCGSSGATG